LEKFGSGGGT